MLAAMWNNRGVLWPAFLAVLALIVLWRGAAPERSILAVFISMIALDRLYHLIVHSGAHFQNVDLGHLTIDLLSAVVLLVIALYANRQYPLWLSALQFVAVISHIIRSISPEVDKGAYSIFMVAPSYLQILVFAVGLSIHLQHQRKRGPYRSWRHY